MERVIDSDELLAPRLRRALRTVEEHTGEAGPFALDITWLKPAEPGWLDEREDPVRGRLRRALLGED
jgi:hypothetical protein